ncbi:MAG: HlyD family efflux transporter periplasmic adaptor subunit [Rhodobiaceae bacterium]|nr:HlyD family efflux transporter periplasmic adaptor subunit [Rhodobiaceae bacterium]
MKVIRERPCQRRHHRVTAPLRIDAETLSAHQTVNWSLGGFRIDQVDGALPDVGQEFSVRIELPFQGFDIKFEAETRVVRTADVTKSVCVEFISLDERSRDLMKHFVEDLIRGKMATIDDTICRIDVPVTPISTQPDPNPPEEMAVTRWPIKTIAMSSFYAALGLCVFGYLSVLIYSSFTQLEVSTAVVSAPVQVMRMPVDGIYRPVGYAEGASVRAGDPLAHIDDMRLQAKISEATANVTQAQDRLWRAEQTFELESERIKLYQVISQVDKDMAAAQVTARTEALRAADAHLQRMKTLWDRGFSTNAQLDDAKARQSLAAARLRESELALEQSTVMNEVAGRRHYNHKEFVSDLDMLLIEVDERRSDLQAARQKLETLETMKDELVVRAPFDGRIVRLMQTGSASVLRDEPLAVLEMNAPTTVTAFLQQEEVLQVGLNDEATVFLPSLDRYVQAEVVRIDRSSAYLDEKQAQYSWRPEDERTATVSLRIQGDPADVADFRTIRPGLPAVVVFNRRSSSVSQAQLARSL